MQEQFHLGRGLSKSVLPWSKAYKTVKAKSISKPIKGKVVLGHGIKRSLGYSLNNDMRGVKELIICIDILQKTGSA
jgi:hypothetical protein